MKNPHRFAIGQHVMVKRTGIFVGGPSGSFTVVRLVPNDGVDREYVVRSKAENYDRVVPESLIQSQLSHHKEESPF